MNSRTIRHGLIRCACALAASAAVASAQTVIDVTSYGAVGDGTTDDTVAIRAAISASAAGDEVYFPAGTYCISNSLTPKSNTQFFGAGIGTTTILYVGTTDNDLIILNEITGLEAAYLTLDGGGTSAEGGDGIKVSSCSGLNVHNLAIQNIGAANSGDGIKMTNNVTGSQFVNCTFTNIGIGNNWCSAFRISSASSNNTITGNTISGTGRGGILCDTNSANLIIENNTITGSGDDGGEGLGIELFDGCTGAVIQNNSVDHWISISGSSNAGVRRNTLTPTDGSVGFTALECVNSLYDVFTDNVSAGGQSLGTSLSGGPEQYNFFAYNSFSAMTTGGIQVQYPNVSNIYFYHETYADSVANAGFRINGGGVQFVTLDTETMTGNPGSGINILGVNQDPPVNWLAVVNCTITNNTDGVWNPSGGTFTDLLWANNTVSGNGNNSVPASVGYADTAPVAIITAPVTASVGSAVTFMSNSNAIDGSIVETLWDLNEGPGVSATSASYSYTTAGIYRITALVWDTVGVGTRVQQLLAVGSGTTYYASGLTVGAQTSSIVDRTVADPNTYNGELTFFDATAVGNYVSYVVPSVAAASYEVLVGYKTNNNKGIWQLSASPAGSPTPTSNIGPAVDAYGSNSTYPQVNLGSWTPSSAGDTWFTFTLTGQNTASSGYDFDVDYIALYPAPTFSANPLTEPAAVVGQAYTGALASSVTDANPSATLVYSLISGPAWLSVSANGALSGTPASANLGTESWVVQATDSSTGFFSDATLNITVYTPIGAWRQQEFGANANTPAIAGDLANPDGDGTPNLLQYAFGTNPNVPHPSPVTISLQTISGQQYLCLTAPKNPAATDATMSVQITSTIADSASWTTNGTTIETNTATTLVVRDSTPISASTARYMRVSVSGPSDP